MKSISIIVDKVGQVAIQTQGFVGQSCKDATKAIEQRLGIVISDKPTYDQGASQSVVETQQ